MATGEGVPPYTPGLFYEEVSKQQAEVLAPQAQAFLEVLSRAALTPIATKVNIATIDPAATAEADFLAQHDIRKPTFFAADPVAAYMQGNAVVGLKQLEASVTTSRHEVFFVRLELEGGGLSVAVKPHASVEKSLDPKAEARKSCMTDYFTNVAAGLASFKSLQPAGFILDPEGMPYSITLLDQDLSTLDSIDWTAYYRQGEKTGGMDALLAKLAPTVADIHDTGDSYHGDLAFRNIATDLDEHVFGIDWEYGKVTTHESVSKEQKFQHELDDLTTLMTNMASPPNLKKGAGVGLFTHYTGSWWEGFRGVFLEKYMQHRRVLADFKDDDWQAIYEFDGHLDELEEALKFKMEALEEKFHPGKIHG